MVEVARPFFAKKASCHILEKFDPYKKVFTKKINCTPVQGIDSVIFLLHTVVVCGEYRSVAALEAPSRLCSKENFGIVDGKNWFKLETRGMTN